MNATDVERLWMLTDLLNFTRRFFVERTDAKFVIGKHHRLICDKLNDVLAGRCNRLIINIAPRYGKTELAVKNFIAAGLALNPAAKFIHLSYSENLALDSSTAIKDIVNLPLYRDTFDARVKKGSDTKQRWDTIQGGGLYATSTLGQITGFGAGCVDSEDGTYKFGGALVIDDPIKPEDALSDVMREAVNRRFETTIRSRVNSRNTPIIIIMQRLHEKDLCGYLMEKEPGKWDVLSLPCLTLDPETGEEQSLWEFKDTVEELHDKWDADAFVFQTQYQQNARPAEGLMYNNLRTYTTLPISDIPPVRKNFTDTADTGSDFLCSIDYLEYPTGMYIIDVMYTDAAMEFTEPEQARMMHKDQIELSNIESNNGGRGYARNVEKNLRLLGNKKTIIRAIPQTGNKETRIYTHSADVQNLIYFPEGWEARWPKFAKAITAFRRTGRNAHDDAPDALTAMTEHFNNFETGEDPSALVTYDAVMEAFTNEDVEETGAKTMSAGITPIHSRLAAVTLTGNVVRIAMDRNPLPYDDAELAVLNYAREKGIPLHLVTVDTDGNYKPGYLKTARAFYAGEAPTHKVYNNLRSECYYKLAKLVNDRKIRIVCHSDQKKQILEEFKVMRRLRVDDGSRKSAVLPLETMRDMLGRTPDILEAMAKAMVFRKFDVREEASINIRTFNDK